MHCVQRRSASAAGSRLRAWFHGTTGRRPPATTALRYLSSPIWGREDPTRASAGRAENMIASSQFRSRTMPHCARRLGAGITEAALLVVLALLPTTATALEEPKRVAFAHFEQLVY